MTGGRSQGVQIIRATCSTAAPTGSGIRYECDDNATWRPVEPCEDTSRLRLGQRVGDRIYPQSGGR